jgi:predicted RNase H-like nuclease
MTLVLGVDGCREGWCCVLVDVDYAKVIEATVLRAFRDVLGSQAAVICIDIPIGLLDRPGRRRCDVEAWRMLGRGRASSVFPPPSRRALSFDDYRAASDVNFQLTGRKLNKQSFNISPKVREVDAVMKTGMQERVREAHPELSFWSLDGGVALDPNKKTRAGREKRWRLLRQVFPDLPAAPNLPEALRGRCQPDDYIDALACAWTAVCVAGATAQRIPCGLEIDEPGLRMEMWYPG